MEKGCLRIFLTSTKNVKSLSSLTLKDHLVPFEYRVYHIQYINAYFIKRLIKLAVHEYPKMFP